MEKKSSSEASVSLTSKAPTPLQFQSIAAIKRATDLNIHIDIEPEPDYKRKISQIQMK